METSNIGCFYANVQRDSTSSPAPSLEGAQALAERVARAADQHQRELAEENDRLRGELAEQRRRQEEAQVSSSRLRCLGDACARFSMPRSAMSDAR